MTGSTQGKTNRRLRQLERGVHVLASHVFTYEMQEVVIAEIPFIPLNSDKTATEQTDTRKEQSGYENPG